MTIEDFNEMLESQNSVCKICGSKPLRKNLSVDHDHHSGEVRGLLCNRCNRVLGMVKDDQDILREMIEYL